MMQLFLEAVDVWLFRDGKPFDAKSDHRARSLFPPYPSVMQGVIRSHHLVVKGVDLRDKQAIEATVGTTDEVGDLRLCGPFIAQRDEKTGQITTRYFPVPANVAPRNGKYQALQLKKQGEGVMVSASAELLPYLLWPPEGSEPTKEDFGAWMTEAELIRCLNGEPAEAVKADTLFARENRFGIGLNDRRTTEEGALYEVEFIRPCKHVGLWVQVTGYDEWPTPGVLRIGGEGRGARFTKVEVASSLKWPSIGDTLPPRFKVYFASPAYFTDGWRPAEKDGKKNSRWEAFFDGAATLQAVALNRYESIGGFDWVTNGQKPARRYVPAGSVYYFSHDGSAKLNQDTITDAGAEIGFGQIIITEWKEQ